MRMRTAAASAMSRMSSIFDMSRYMSARSNGVMNWVCSRPKAPCTTPSARCSTSLMARTLFSTSVRSSSSAATSWAPSTVAAAWASNASKNSSDFGISFSSMVLPPSRRLRGGNGHVCLPGGQAGAS